MILNYKAQKKVEELNLLPFTKNTNYEITLKRNKCKHNIYNFKLFSQIIYSEKYEHNQTN